MNDFKKNLKIFFLYSKFSLKTIFQARMGVVFFMIGKIIRFAFFFFLILLLFTRIKTIGGYQLNQAIIFYLTFNIIDTASQILFREVYRFRYQVLSGSFDLILLKPHHPFLRILIGGIDFLDLILLAPYLALTLFFAFHFISLLSIISYLLLIINSLTIATAFHISVLATAILTTEVDHSIMIYRDMTTLGRFPIDIYKEPIRGIFTFIIPIGVMMSFPPKALFNLLSPSLLLYSLSIGALFLFLSLKLWGSALKKYQSWGG